MEYEDYYDDSDDDPDDEHEDEGHEEHGGFGVADSSDASKVSGSAGITYFSDNGFLGLSFSGFGTKYGVPGHHHHGEDILATLDSHRVADDKWMSALAELLKVRARTVDDLAAGVMALAVLQFTLLGFQNI